MNLNQIQICRPVRLYYREDGFFASNSYNYNSKQTQIKLWEDIKYVIIKARKVRLSRAGR